MCRAPALFVSGPGTASWSIYKSLQHYRHMLDNGGIFRVLLYILFVNFRRKSLQSSAVCVALRSSLGRVPALAVLGLAPFVGPELCIGAFCRAPAPGPGALCVRLPCSVLGPALCVSGARRSLSSLFLSGRQLSVLGSEVCVGARQSLCQGPALFVLARRFLCRALCRGPVVSASRTGTFSLSVSRPAVGPGALVLGQRSLYRAPALSVSRPSGLSVWARHCLCRLSDASVTLAWVVKTEKNLKLLQ